MFHEKTTKDLISHSKGETSIEFERLINRLQAYTGMKEIESITDLVDLFLVVAVAMDVSEEVFDKAVNRLNHVMVKKVTGLDPEQIMAMAESKKPTGPVQ